MRRSTEMHIVIKRNHSLSDYLLCFHKLPDSSSFSLCLQPLNQPTTVSLSDVICDEMEQKTVLHVALAVCRQLPLGGNNNLLRGDRGYELLYTKQLDQRSHGGCWRRLMWTRRLPWSRLYMWHICSPDPDGRWSTVRSEQKYSMLH